MHATSRTLLSIVAGFVLAGAVGTLGQSPIAKAADKEPTFTYYVRYINMDRDPTAEMDKKGKEGWELVSVGPTEEIPERDNKGNVQYNARKSLMVFKKKQ